MLLIEKGPRFTVWWSAYSQSYLVFRDKHYFCAAKFLKQVQQYIGV